MSICWIQIISVSYIADRTDCQIVTINTVDNWTAWTYIVCWIEEQVDWADPCFEVKHSKTKSSQWNSGSVSRGWSRHSDSMNTAHCPKVVDKVNQTGSFSRGELRETDHEVVEKLGLKQVTSSSSWIGCFVINQHVLSRRLYIGLIESYHTEVKSSNGSIHTEVDIHQICGRRSWCRRYVQINRTPRSHRRSRVFICAWMEERSHEQQYFVVSQWRTELSVCWSRCCCLQSIIYCVFVVLHWRTGHSDVRQSSIVVIDRHIIKTVEVMREKFANRDVSDFEDPNVCISCNLNQHAKRG